MSTVKVAITIQEHLVDQLDRLVKAKVFPNRSRAVQQAVEEKLARLDRNRLARECAKLDPASERAMAEEGMSREIAEWPEY
ncbi:MAG TPA: ribbon-helix-helix domain-containing protein [bacterium]|nr:ribbon-helix-helix domain-containing protein [bacterium]HQO35550.1 ribbon-helix-helix domain-containing protein [bacterium]HQP96860.1 ribbon-helix-helix domain-containing protein [bacterium]